MIEIINIIYGQLYTCIQKVKYGAQSVYDTLEARLAPFRLPRFCSTVTTMNWVFTGICNVGSKKSNAKH
jgi:hypothetical protein